MSPDNVQLLLLLITSLTCLLFARSIYIRKQLDAMKKQLQERELQFAETRQQLAQLKEIEQRFTSFKNDLHVAELSNKILKPRIQSAYESESVAIPERYRYIRSLKEKGLSDQEIASILTISLCEAQQVLKLAALASD